MNVDKLFSGLNISSLGMSAQRRRMNAIAENMANVETTRTEDGGPYRRKTVILKSEGGLSFASSLNSASVKLTATDMGHFGQVSNPLSMRDTVPGSVESIETEDTSPFKLQYDPSHPDADENGYVKLPNINVVTEMVDMISASRAYEANVTAINAEKTMAKDALEI